MPHTLQQTDYTPLKTSYFAVGGGTLSEQKFTQDFKGYQDEVPMRGSKLRVDTLDTEKDSSPRHALQLVHKSSTVSFGSSQIQKTESKKEQDSFGWGCGHFLSATKKEEIMMICKT